MSPAAAAVDAASSSRSLRAVPEGLGSLRIMMIQTQAENAGAQEVSRLLSEALLARGYDVHQLFLFRRTNSFDDVPNAIFCADQRPQSPLALARLLAKLFRELRRVRPHAVLCFQHYGNLIAAPIARMAGAPVVIANQTSATLTTPTPALQIDKILGTRGLFDRIVVNSQDAALEYRAHPSAYRDRLVRIDHGFRDKSSTLAKAEARQSLALPERCVLLGCVARLHALKGLDDAVRLLPQDPRWHLALAGQGPMRQELIDLARALDCADRLHLLGELPSAKVGDFLAALDAFVFPSRAETFGLAVVEAAQAGVPVVANRLEVLEEVLAVEGKPCALFVDARDPEAFAAAVRRALDDVLLVRTLCARGRMLKRRYSLDAMVDGYEKLMRGLLAEKLPERRA